MSFKVSTTTRWAGDAWKNAFDTEMVDGYLRSAENIRDDAKARAPRKKGILINTIRSGKSEKQGAAFVFAGALREGIIYPPFQEYGTSDIPAQPFMRPAADGNTRSTLTEADRTGRQVLSKQRRFKTKTRKGA